MMRVVVTITYLFSWSSWLNFRCKLRAKAMAPRKPEITRDVCQLVCPTPLSNNMPYLSSLTSLALKSRSHQIFTIDLQGFRIYRATDYQNITTVTLHNTALIYTYH